MLASEPLNVAILTDSFPEFSETFIAEEARAMRAAGHVVRVEARAHAARPNTAALEGLAVGWQEDDAHVRRLAELARLSLRRPPRVARDLRGRQSWASEEVWVAPLRVLAPVAARLR